MTIYQLFYETVVKTIKKLFCSDFTYNKTEYNYPYYDTNKSLVWNIPMKKKRISLFNDDSTYKSGKILMFRWLFPGIEPLFRIGRFRSIMVRQLIAHHPSVL